MAGTSTWNIYESPCSFPVLNCPCLCVDAFHAAVQPAGEVTAAEVVHSHSGARQEEDGQGADADSARPQTKDVQLPRMEGPQDCLQKVKKAKL